MAVMSAAVAIPNLIIFNFNPCLCLSPFSAFLFVVVPIIIPFPLNKALHALNILFSFKPVNPLIDYFQARVQYAVLLAKATIIDRNWHDQTN